MDAASRVEVRRSVLFVEVGRGPDPLGRPLEVGRPAARGDDAAAREHHGVKVLHLAAKRSSHRLVEQRRTFSDPAQLDQRGTELASRTHVKVCITGLTCRMQRLASLLLRGYGIFVVKGYGFTEQHPPAKEPRVRFPQRLGWP